MSIFSRMNLRGTFAGRDGGGDSLDRTAPAQDTSHSASNGHVLQPAVTVIPLAAATSGQHLRLVDTCAGRRLAHRLAELGLTRGITLCVVQNSGGPLLISVRGSRIALGRELASKLFMTPVAHAEDGEKLPVSSTSQMVD